MGGAHCLCFVRCWVGVGRSGRFHGNMGASQTKGKVGIGSQEGVSGKTLEGVPPSAGQAEMQLACESPQQGSGRWRPGCRGRGRKAPSGLHPPAALRYHSSPLPFWDEEGSWRPREAVKQGGGSAPEMRRPLAQPFLPATSSTAPRLLGRHLKGAGGPSHACTSPMTRTSHFSWVLASGGRESPTAAHDESQFHAWKGHEPF